MLRREARKYFLVKRSYSKNDIGIGQDIRSPIFNMPEKQTRVTISSDVEPNTNPSLRTNFDSSRFVKLLNEEGFTQIQAEGIISLISEVIQESMDTTSKLLVTKADQQKFLEDCSTELQKIRREIHTIENLDFGQLRSRIENIKTGVDASKTQSRERFHKVQAGVRLDMNLEKSRIQVEFAELQKDIQAAELKMDQQLDKLDKRFHAIKIGTQKGISRFLIGVFGSLVIFKGVSHFYFEDS